MYIKKLELTKEPSKSEWRRKLWSRLSHISKLFFPVIILFDSIPLRPYNHNPSNLWKENQPYVFVTRQLCAIFCSGDDNVHELICTKTIFYCKSHTHRHKHQDLVKKKHRLSIGRCDPDLSSHLQTLSLHSNTYTHTNAHWCNLTNSENAEQGTGHGETGTLWTKANRQMWFTFSFRIFWKVSDQQDFKTQSSLKALCLLKQNGFKFDSKKQSCWHHPKSC